MSRGAFLATVGLFSILSVVLWLATGFGDALAESTSSSESDIGTRPGQVQENRPPRFSDFTNNRSVAENLPSGSPVGLPVQATDPDGDTLTYSLGGTDAASFGVAASSGQLQTNAALDYETKSSYTVTVTAADPYDASDTITVTINVTDADDAGKIIFSSAQPEAYTGLVATVVDDDIVQSIQSWQWEISGSNNTWTTITGAATGTYVPLDNDVGKYLRVTATYTDRYGSGKTATATTTNLVEDEDEDEDEGPAFSTGTAHRSIAENAAANTNIGSPLTATDPENDPLTYSLEGTDAASFAIVASTGQLQTKAALDYEVKNSYTVTVKATDPSLDSGAITVNITVTNVDPPGKPGTPTVAAASVGGDNSLLVAWAAPANTRTAISGYNVQYRAGTGGSWLSILRRVSSTATTVSGLASSTTYQVRVRAYNSEGSGPWSDPGQGSTAAQRQREILRGSGGALSPVCTPSIGFRTGIPFSFTAAKGGEEPPGLWMEVWDRELCGMNFRVSSSAKWLSVSPASGRSEGAHDQRLVRLSAGISGLGVGMYKAIVRITALESGNSPRTVSVSLTITEPIPLKPENCQERTVIESSDGAIRVVVPLNSMPCDTGITVASLAVDSQQTPAGKSVDIVRVGKVSAASADSRINAGLWVLLPGDRVSGCEGASADVYRVDGYSWESLTHRCEMDEQGRVWTVSPLTSFGVYAVTLPAPAVESVIADEVQEPGAGAAGTDVSLDPRVPCRILVVPDLPPPETERCQWLTIPGLSPPEEGPSCQQLIVSSQSGLDMVVEEDPECSLKLTAPTAGIAFADDSIPGSKPAPPSEEITPAVEGTGPRATPAALSSSQPGGMAVLPYAAAAIATAALLLAVFAARRMWRRKTGAVGS